MFHGGRMGGGCLAFKCKFKALDPQVQVKWVAQVAVSPVSAHLNCGGIEYQTSSYLMAKALGITGISGNTFNGAARELFCRLRI